MPTIPIMIAPSTRVEEITASEELVEFVRARDHRAVALALNTPMITGGARNALGIVAAGTVVVFAFDKSTSVDSAPLGASLRELDLGDLAEALGSPIVSDAVTELLKEFSRRSLAQSGAAEAVS